MVVHYFAIFRYFNLVLVRIENSNFESDHGRFLEYFDFNKVESLD